MILEWPFIRSVKVISIFNGMHPRSMEILEAAVRDFIHFGAPVSSASLFERYDFGIRPAMIRAELALLTGEGYLVQPHHSAGRVPTDRGYEFFAVQVLEYMRPRPLRSDLAELFHSGALDQFLVKFASELGIATAAFTPGEEIHKEGLEDLMENIEWGPRANVVEIVRDFELLEDRLRAAREKLIRENGLDVFIGRKSPITKSEELAVMTADFEKDGEHVLLIAMGPKRMNYEKAAGIFKALKNR